MKSNKIIQKKYQNNIEIYCFYPNLEGGGKYSREVLK
jgi:hypothetical protein